MACLADPELKSLVDLWLELDRNNETCEEILTMSKGNNVDELRSRLTNRMVFGTAGLRSRMGAGFSLMNDLTIIQTAQGLFIYCVNAFGIEKLKSCGIIIGFDARYHSKDWAFYTASIFIQKGVKVFLFDDYSPTPFVPFGVRHFGCVCGVMVTASHNPKDDNGYKVYWHNGAQILSPHDQGIQAAILENLVPWNGAWDKTLPSSHILRIKPDEEILATYLRSIKRYSCRQETVNVSAKLLLTYTAMHGVGYKVVKELVKSFGVPAVIPVTEQVKPDADFPTVKYPNPEEGKSALDLAMHTAEKHGSTVILANDPDADRFAMAEKQRNGKWRIFSGNETAALFGWWLWKNKPDDLQAKDCCMISSTVSSSILKTIADKEGFNFTDTLTGFKWIANKARELELEGKTVLFCFEEAIGFMVNTVVLDKDGISALGVAAELAIFLDNQGKKISDKLDEIYKEYGYHIANNGYFICHDLVIINRIFERLRNYESKGQYPSSLFSAKVKGVRDLTTGFDNNQPDNKATLPVSKSSQMITFTLDNGIIMTLRTSGTEPKIKFYTELCTKPGAKELTDDMVRKELAKYVDAMCVEWLEASKNGLIPQPRD